ncbi:hemicentin-2-like isoform X1 [Uloborus diversus]|uniref:hemicentin-2-like isoform X1 n=1 Tax=Uloborus diversus TaxID=327109 RepID=UPI00240963F1|nr:hemicentin-2-like isoform X1 [Uloborus diversus]
MVPPAFPRIIPLLWTGTGCLFALGYCAAIGSSRLTVVAGGRAELPCDLNLTLASLVLWHRGFGAGTPLYSVDARAGAGLANARHFSAPSLGARAHFQEGRLTLDPVQESDDGSYRCRVEYKRSRTQVADLKLHVIVPPKEAIIMDEYGQHLHGIIGPYNEGFPLALACEGEGGNPSPAVRWWRDAELLDDSFYITPQGFARNELLLPSLRRTDLLSRLTCQVSNSNLSAPVTSSVVIDMNLKPTEVQITSLFRPLSLGRPTEIVCMARGARPPAQISWWLDGEKLISRVTESSSRDENLTVSSLLFSPGKHDNQRNLSCRGDNPQIPDSVLEDSWLLDIHFPPQLTVKVDKKIPVVEGTSISFTCVVQANPAVAEHEWLKDGNQLVENIQNQTLIITDVQPEHKGSYQCAAINNEGRTISSALELKVHYAPRCQSVRSSVFGVGRSESVSVSCEVDAEPKPLAFSWALEGATPLAQSHFSSEGSRSVATLSPRTPNDYGLLMCWAANAIGRQREPCTFRIVPAGPPEEPRECEVGNRSNSCISVYCEGGPDGGLEQVFQLEVYGTVSDRMLMNVSARATPIFRVCSLPREESLLMLVYAINTKGRSKLVTVHVDASDKKDDADSGTASVIFGMLVGAMLALILIGMIVAFAVRIRSTGLEKGRKSHSDASKKSSNSLKECKEPCVASSLGPDIIPEKSFFQERMNSQPKVIEMEEGVNPASAINDPRSKKYQTSFTDSTLLTSPRKLRLLHESGDEKVESGLLLETPLVSSIPPILQQWPNRKKEALHLSTPV